MRNARIEPNLVMVLCLVWFLEPRTCSAGLITIHNTVETSIDNVAISSDGPVDTGLEIEVDSAGMQGAQAAAGTSFGHLLRDYAVYDAPSGNGIDSTKNASAISGHSDVVYWNGTEPAPDSLRLIFHVDGSFAKSAYPVPDIHPIINTYLNVSDGEHMWYAGFGGNGPGSAAFDSLTFNGSSFDATIHIDAPFDAGYGGYYWSIAMQAFANGAFSTGTTDFLNTASLTAVTQLDGTPVTNIAFDSGLTLDASATPEPTSLGLTAVGMLSLAVWRRRAKMQSNHLSLPTSSVA